MANPRSKKAIGAKKNRVRIGGRLRSMWFACIVIEILPETREGINAAEHGGPAKEQLTCLAGWVAMGGRHSECACYFVARYITAAPASKFTGSRAGRR
jgi:hypothetical protein